MSLGIAFKGPEGIVLAADSRVTLTLQIAGPPPVVVPAAFDNARKLLRVQGQDFIGVVTYGLGALGQAEPRTAHSLLPDFERELEGQPRLAVSDFAQRLSAFFMARWNEVMPAAVPPGNDMIFLVGGFDEDAAYGAVYEIYIPSRPIPTETNPGQFGLTWGGQREVVDRMLQGFDDRLPGLLSARFGLSNADAIALRTQLQQQLSMPIPYPFLPLQDCVDLSILLVRTTAALQGFVIGVRGVGGRVDCATITRTEGFREIQMKQIEGEAAVPGRR